MTAVKPLVLVAYASGSGSTAEVAEAIAAEIRAGNARVVVYPAGEVTDITEYSAVVVGSSIRGGRWLPDAVHLVENHAVDLASRPVAYFTTCLTMVEDTPENRHIVRGYLEPVLALAPDVQPVGLGLFAGSLNPSIQSMVPGGGPYGDYRNWTQIREWAVEITPLLLAAATPADRPVVWGGQAGIEKDLTGLDMPGAEMTGAALHAARLQAARLPKADLQTADLSSADLRGAELVQAQLGWADLHNADIRGANLQQANLMGANLKGARLDQADLSAAIMNGADLTGATLNEANLARADLNWAVLRQAQLAGADLSRANLGWADFSQTDLVGVNLQKARYNKQTKWPEDFSPETAGCILVSGPY